jgi:hypothetical protein
MTHTDQTHEASRLLTADLGACYRTHGAMSRFTSGEWDHLIGRCEAYHRERKLAVDLEGYRPNGYSYGPQTLEKWRTHRKRARAREARS